jgi:methylenetetrahydrofolate dehydrogenase (NADP+) / methenyltetrahydrofolate cyclohydrolase
MPAILLPYLGTYNMTIVLDGRNVAAALREELRAEVAGIQQTHAVAPRLDVVYIEGDPASAWYVNAIAKACKQVGIDAQLTVLHPDLEQHVAVETMQRLGAQRETHGILLQLPLPPHIDAQAVIAALDPAKDVDGQHPLSLGRLAQGLPTFVPNTPAGGIELLRRYDLPIAGKHAVVVGRSNVVGKPMALLLLHEHATVTIAHSRTPDLPTVIGKADIVAVAVGRPGLVTGAMLKPGAVVLDFGINETVEGGIVGDVDYESAAAVAGAITPVPGGTGPVTNMMLLRNVVEAAKQQLG